MYTKMLVPLDESSIGAQVLPYARFVSERLKLPIELLTAIDLAGIASSHGPEVHNFNKLMLDIREAGETYLEQTCKMFGEVSVRCSVQTGKAEEVIIQEASQDKQTLIAMATHGRSGLGRWLLGSVAEKVLRGATNPLLLVRAGERGKADDQINFQSIIVPLDTSELAETALGHAAELAKRLNSTIILAHAYVHPLAAYYASGDYYNPHYKSLATQFKGEAHKYIEEKVAELKRKGLEKVSTIFFEGSPAEEIIAFAGREPNSLLAMCTHGRSGVSRWAFGSVTEKVVRHCDNPVLVIRAAGGAESHV